MILFIRTFHFGTPAEEASVMLCLGGPLLDEQLYFSCGLSSPFPCFDESGDACDKLSSNSSY